MSVTLSVAWLYAGTVLVPGAPQDPALHAQYVGGYDVPGDTYADIWGEPGFAYVAHFGQALVEVLDLSDPANPTLAASLPIPSPNNGASAQDVKAGDGLLFVSLESGGVDGVLIVDVRDPANPVPLTTIDAEPGPYENIHNTFYDGGWLYLCDSSNPVIALVDLRSYDPDNAPAQITSWTHEITGAGQFVHDITVQDGKLYASCWSETRVYDVSDLDAGPPVFLGSAAGMSAHANWPTPDGAFLLSTEERGGGGVRLYQVLDGGPSVELVQRDSYNSPASGAYSTYSAHNVLFVGDRAYVSNYSAGLLVLELDRASMTLEKVASYDTSVQPSSGFYGNWGVYPYLGEATLLLSDLEEGFVVVDASALALSTPKGRPTRIPPGRATAVTVEVEELERTLAAGSVTLYARVDGGASVPIATTPLGGGLHEGLLPAAACGARVDYWFEARDTTGETYTKPAAAPAETFTTYATEGGELVFADDFEADRGWTVADVSVSTGTWERAVPVGSGGSPDAGLPFEPGDSCYVTANGVPGGSIGAADLDGGPTRLTSPTLDFSGGDGLISYSRWLFNNNVDADALVTEVSDDGGASWTTVESVAGESGGWVRRVFRVSDHVTPTAQVVVRFSATDNPNNSVTEAGIDGFRAERFRCSIPVLASATVRNGSGVNPSCLTSVSLPVLGTTWHASVDTQLVGGATRSLLVGTTAPHAGLPTPYGELLVALPALGGQKLFQTSVPSATGTDPHAISLPPDPSLAGRDVHVQAAVLGAQARLCNALHLVLGS